jgi:hypothetical protein
MGRILVLLTFAGLAAVFVIIYNARFEPVQSAVTTNSNAAAQGNTRRTKPGQLDQKKRAQSPRTRSAKWNKYPSTASANRTEDDAAAAVDRKAADARSDPLMTVKADSTPVYSANTKRSKVLRRLRRGDKVQPDLEVIDSEGRWRLVKVPGRGKPGFVRDEQIERPLTDGSSKNKQVGEQPKQQ